MKLKMVITFDPFTVDPTKLMAAVQGCNVSTEDIETHAAREVAAPKKAKAAKVGQS